MEKIEVWRHSPKWQPRFAIRITGRKEEVLREKEADGTEIKIYTDGSGLDNAIGVAAVLYRDRQWKTTKLGSEKEHTVYEGEVVGTGLGIELLQAQKRVKLASFYINNQTCLLGTQSICSTPDHYLLDHTQSAAPKHPPENAMDPGALQQCTK